MSGAATQDFDGGPTTEQLQIASASIIQKLGGLHGVAALTRVEYLAMMLLGISGLRTPGRHGAAGLTAREMFTHFLAALDSLEWSTGGTAAGRAFVAALRNRTTGIL